MNTIYSFFKNIKYFSTISLIILLFNSCQFEKECYYGCLFGDCIDGTCFCNEGWTGVDCRIQKTPTAIKIYRIDILSFPQYNSNGSPWDVGSNPDVYVLFRKDNIVLYNQPNFFSNAIHTNLYSVYPQDSITITDLSANYSVSLIDYDETTTDNFMGGIGFNIYNDRNEFPSTFVHTFEDLSFRIYVSYEWN